MEAVAKGRTPDGAALKVLTGHANLIGWQVANQRASLALKLLTAAAGIAVAAGLAVLVWQASRAQGLVVDPFSVPPGMAERGLDGAAVASLFLDELSLLQAQTDSGRAPSSFRNNWGDDLSVQIAQTGVSVNDLYRMLVDWVGEETRMTGGVSQGPDGLSIVVRTGSRPIEAATGEEAELEALLRLAAERVFEQTQPYRYAALLAARQRDLPPGSERAAVSARRTAILRALTSSESAVERAWAYNGLGVSEDRPVSELMPLLRAGLAIDPEHPFLLSNLSGFSDNLGHDEAGYKLMQRALAAIRKRPRHLNPAVIPANEPQYAARLAVGLGDFAAAAALLAAAGVAANANFSADTAPPAHAWVLAEGHDPAAAAALLRTRDLADDAAVAERIGARALATPFAAIAAERGQWAAALAELEAADAVYARKLIPRDAMLRRTRLWPQLARARAQAGDLAGAQALIAATPTDCYLCVRERARIAEMAGDRRAADRWSAEAVRQGPSLPFAHAERGQMLLGRGDRDGAIAQFRLAHEKGPRWADPLKLWGDALAGEGDPAAAVRKYAEAADRAPRWGALHLAWGRALQAQGRTEPAMARYRRAAALDLSPEDRRLVERLSVSSGDRR